jgi:hypothetical protein
MWAPAAVDVVGPAGARGAPKEHSSVAERSVMRLGESLEASEDFPSSRGHSPEVTRFRRRVMRTIHRIEPGRRLRHPGPGFPRSAGLCWPGSDTSLDYRERTISRTEVATLRHRLIPAEAVHLRAGAQAEWRARTTSGKWSDPGVGR